MNATQQNSIWKARKHSTCNIGDFNMLRRKVLKFSRHSAFLPRYDHQMMMEKPQSVSGLQMEMFNYF